MAIYYVKISGGTGSGLDDANAWSYAKYNSAVLAIGDTVLFKRGETYYGAINANYSGTNSDPITYGTYDSGANPIITGFFQPSSWTFHTGNIYYTTLTIGHVSMVTVDGIVRWMGRYPKNSYLQYTSSEGNYRLIGPDIAALPANFSGADAEVVVKKFRYIIDRQISVTQDSANSNLQYGTGEYDYYGNNAATMPSNGNGFFIQNHLNCLTQDGEWYYNPATKRLYMYFLGGPSGRVVKASNISTLLDLSNKSYINLNGIDFQGSDYAIYSSGAASHFNITNCNFRYQGMSSIYAQGDGGGTNNVILDSIKVEDANNNGITGLFGCNNWTIKNSVVDRVGVIPGASKSGDAAACGIFLSGDNSLIEKNRITNIGYCGISFEGADATIQKNMIETYCKTKDDGGGIYTYTGTNALITKNIILNGVGCVDGTGADIGEQFGKGAGVYLDQGVVSHAATVTDNFIAVGSYGAVFINSTGGETITNNTFYDRSRGIQITNFESIQYPGTRPRNLIVTGNRVISKSEGDAGMFLQLGSADDISQMGTFDDNIYASPVHETAMILYKSYQNFFKPYSLPQWKEKFGIEATSTESAVKINNENKFAYHYNHSDAPVTVALDGLWHDVEGVAYNNSITIPAYSGVVLMKYVEIAHIQNGKLSTINGKTMIKKQLFV